MASKLFYCRARNKQHKLINNINSNNVSKQHPIGLQSLHGLALSVREDFAKYVKMLYNIYITDANTNLTELHYVRTYSKLI